MATTTERAPTGYGVFSFVPTDQLEAHGRYLEMRSLIRPLAVLTESITTESGLDDDLEDLLESVSRLSNMATARLAGIEAAAPAENP